MVLDTSLFNAQQYKVRIKDTTSASTFHVDLFFGLIKKNLLRVMNPKASSYECNKHHLSA